jgi:hypothetical protein
MADWLDELLEVIPVEPYPPDLVAQVQARLANSRRWSRWARNGVRLAMVMAGVLGLWLLMPKVEILLSAVSSISLGGLEEWLSAMMRSPSDALLDLSQIAVTWVSQLAAGLEAELVLALGLLATPALYGVISLLSSGISQEEAII